MTTTRSRCRSCAARIIWAQTATGRRMPVDADAHPDGTIVLTDVRGHVTAAVVGPDHPGPKHRPHFATCPDAQNWRRR